MLPTRAMLKFTLAENPTTQPESMRRTSPATNSRLITAPHAWTKTSPSPSNFCRMKPSPPKKPTPNDCEKPTWMLVPIAAHKKACLEHMMEPPSAPKSMPKVWPGIGEEKTIFRGLVPLFTICSIANEAPASMRFPASLMFAHQLPLGREPSLNCVSKSMSLSRKQIEPLSAMIFSLGWRTTSTIWRSWPMRVNSNLLEHLAKAAPDSANCAWSVISID
mmetsp:Transcript_104791/g.263887  ORF Transcript_104791/g.263887 Transcript_104791/m.263887 type:complete len:219 (+) Transcript_104791:359-1015(+)